MDAASTDYLLTLARMASLNPSVMFHVVGMDQLPLVGHDHSLTFG
jgi:hypothetical protein